MVNVNDLKIGDEVRMDAVGTVVRVYSHGSADIQWHDSKFENGIDADLLELIIDQPEGFVSERDQFYIDLQRVSRDGLIQRLWDAQTLIHERDRIILEGKYGLYLSYERPQGYIKRNEFKG